MKKLLLIVLLVTSVPAFADTAYWTGRMESGRPAGSYEIGWNCEYRAVNGDHFWLWFRTSCPPSVEI